MDHTPLENQLQTFRTNFSLPIEFEGPLALLASNLSSRLKEAALLTALLQYLNLPEENSKNQQNAPIQVRILKLYPTSLTNEGFAFVLCADAMHRRCLLHSTNLVLRKRILLFTDPVPLDNLMTQILYKKGLQLHVRKLREKSTELDIKNYFSFFGVVDSVEIARNFRNNRSLGYATVRFESKEGVERALQQEVHILQGKKVMCRPFLLKSETQQIQVKNLQISNELPKVEKKQLINQVDAEKIEINEQRDELNFAMKNSESEDLGFLGSELVPSKSDKLCKKKCEKKVEIDLRRVRAPYLFLASYTDPSEPNYRFNWQKSYDQ